MALSWNSYQSWLKDILATSRFPKTPPPSPETISTDSRQIKNGDWFIPLIGENFDGHNFIKEVVSKGASGFFYTSSYKDKLDKSLCEKGVEVSDTLKALQAIAHGLRRTLGHTKIIALTGSTGKTTTKEMTGLLLQQIGKTYFSKESFNNEIGVPLSLLKLSQNHRYTVLEFGARHQGDIEFLNSLAEPDVVACLNIGITHLGEFGSIEKLVETKLEIFRQSQKNSILVAFNDDSRILNAAKKMDRKLITFGLNPGANVRVKDVSFKKQPNGPVMDIEFEVYRKNISASFSFAHSAYPINLAAAIAMSLAAGADTESITKSLNNINLQNIGGGGRFNLISLGPLTLIDDCYNANPDSIKAGLETLSKIYPKEKKVLVLGEMLELGPESERLHRAVGEICASIKPSFLITVGTEAQAINDAALKKGLNQQSVVHFSNVDELMAANFNLQTFGSIIFVKGSNGVKLSKYIAHLKTK